ncbi:MAG: beta strand repeat-containing protein [Flavisolibacter sp.]
MRKKLPITISFWIIFLLFLAVLKTAAQEGGTHTIQPVFTPRFITPPSADLFGTRKSFIKNLGQYGSTMKGRESLGKILYGYEGMDMPVLFTSKGLIHLQRKLPRETETERERERNGEREREEHQEKGMEEERPVDRVITMEWLGANPDVQVIAEGITAGYHNYASLRTRVPGYEKILYKNLYPGIDLQYLFTGGNKAGFQYNLLVHAGADLSVVRVKFGGDLKKIRVNDGWLSVSSDIEGISASVPQSFYSNEVGEKSESIPSSYRLNGDELSFSIPAYDHSRTIIIDPFVTSTGNLTGLNAGKAKDVDFDYNGNIYVTGGGSSSVHQLAKYDANGALQWTFNGTLAIPSWTFGSYWGGWMVEKPTGNIYLGQGFNPTTGFQVIRVSTTGLYDNFITNANPNFREAWKMYWSCNNGSPQILVAGGGTNSNINFGVFTPPSTSITSLNVTGIPYTVSSGWAQDIVDFIIDPFTNDMYTLYASLIGNPSLTNKIYKNKAPYSAASIDWNVASGFTTVQEIANRPYLLGGQIDNSANIFGINSNYLFYWDGKNLKAFDKSTGAAVGAPLITANTALMQGGIVADACNNVFVGDGNGVIKVYQFNGNSFDDAAAPDIPVPGFAGKSIYDLAYDESKKLLYASGDGFVASFDISSYCRSTQYTLTINPDCTTQTALVSVSPAPPPGSTITYVLSTGGTEISRNTTGQFTNLLPNTNYTILATINLACSGTQVGKTFVLPGPLISVTQTNSSCGNSTGQISIQGSGGIAPYLYSIDGITFQSSGIFTGLSAGVYTITAKDANGCSSKTTATILNSNGPLISFSTTDASCGNAVGTIQATVSAGTAPYQYSIGGAFQGSNFFAGLTGGNYTLVVKDANGCTNSSQVVINSTSGPTLTAIPSTASCGNSNGIITVFGTGAVPLQYSINGNIFQVGNVFSGLSPGPYTVTVKDANGCLQTSSAVVGNSIAPSISLSSSNASCNNANGTITANGSGGIAPLQFSLNGSPFQSNNIFTGLAAGNYSVAVRDSLGCTSTASISVSSLGGPSLSASSTASGCLTGTGIITLTASGGVPPFQYSINGSSFQSSNIFSGVASGNYVVYVRDQNGCIGTSTITVLNTAGPSLSLTVSPTACNANTGVITANATGGTGGLSFSIDGINYQSANSFSGLGAGNYTVYVKDVNGCIASKSAALENVSGLSLQLSSISSSCSGVSGSITALATGGVLPLQYSIDGLNYQQGNTFTGLSPQNYTVYVKDAGGCALSKQTVVQIVSGPSLLVSLQQNGTCGTASGVIRAQGTGGIQPLSFSLDGGAFQPGGIFVNLNPGPHTVTLKDAAGCSVSQTVSITNSGAGSAPTDISFTIKDALPCTAGTGRIKNLKGVPGGGGNTYRFSLDGGAFTTANQFFSVPAGVHTITAQNQTGCTITKLVTVGNGPAASATATVTPSLCNGNTGTITISGTGPNTPYHASIDNGVSWVTFFPPGANSFVFTGLAAGTYKIIIADDADFTAGPPDIPGACLTNIFVAVPSTGGPSLSVSQVDPNCSSTTGSITVNGSGGTSPYSYSINGGAYFPSGVFNNLAPGNYALSVKDATGCSTGSNIILLNPSPPIATAITAAASCNEKNGSIRITATGSAAPLGYSINGTEFQSGNVFTNLAPGNYTVYVKDANGCFSTITVAVNNTPLPRLTAFPIAASCKNNDGIIVANAAQGTPPYLFSINGTVYQSSDSFPNLGAGFYTVYLKDASGCTAITGIALSNVSGPSITSILASPAFCDQSTGSVQITASGIAPLEYSINAQNFQTGAVFSSLLAGTYNVLVRDANGCVASGSILVGNTNGPSVLTASVKDASCNNANGSITISATGGKAPLLYSINGTSYQDSPFFDQLIAAAYTLYAKDANGCIKTIPVTVSNLPGPALTALSTPASCAQIDGTIRANAIGGTGALLFSIDGINFQKLPVFTGLPAGQFIVTVKDVNGCSSSAPVLIQTSGAVATPLFNNVVPICSGESLAPLPLQSLNGVQGTWSPALNNTVTTTYSFTPDPGQCAGKATLTIVVHPKPSALIIYHN